MTVSQYTHHGVEVFVIDEMKGKHRDICLCFQGCGNFIPDNTEKNCPVAQAVFETCVMHHIVTPVLECPQFYEWPF
jgi:hypothetical protein